MIAAYVQHIDFAQLVCFGQNFFLRDRDMLHVEVVRDVVRLIVDAEVKALCATFRQDHLVQGDHAVRDDVERLFYCRGILIQKGGQP